MPAGERRGCAWPGTRTPMACASRRCCCRSATTRCRRSRRGPTGRSVWTPPATVGAALRTGRDDRAVRDLVWCVRSIGTKLTHERAERCCRDRRHGLIAVGVARSAASGRSSRPWGSPRSAREPDGRSSSGSSGWSEPACSSMRRSSGGPQRHHHAPVSPCSSSACAIDQVGHSRYPEELSAQRWAADTEVVGDLQSNLPDDAMVFQLPVVQFPAELVTVEMQPNDHFGPFAAGDGTLRWSAGALSGREGDWQRSLIGMPPDQVARAVAAAGFSALYVDRRGSRIPTGSSASWSRSWGRRVSVSLGRHRAMVESRPRRANWSSSTEWCGGSRRRGGDPSHRGGGGGVAGHPFDQGPELAPHRSGRSDPPDRLRRRSVAGGRLVLVLG